MWVLLITYIFGGLTFFPVLAGLIFLYAYYTLPNVHGQFVEAPDLRHINDDEKAFPSPEVGSKAWRATRNETDVASGYFAVTREYVPGGINGRPPDRPSLGTSTPPESPSVYQSMYRSLFDRKPTTPSVSSNAKGKNVFFVAMRHGHLMLYDDADQVEVRHVISLSHHDVSLYGGEDETIPEGELFIKRNAIRLSRRVSNIPKDQTTSSKPFYLFSENCSEKEDFYFALIKHQGHESDDVSASATPLAFEQKDIIALVQRLHSSEEHMQIRWLNGLAGRLFLSVYKTTEIEDFFKTRITKKIARVKKPNFLSDIVIQKIDVGEGVPLITNPRMKDLTVDGEFAFEADVNYTGGFRLEVAAVATLNLGARIKSRQVNLVLAIVLKKLEGHVVVKIKPPPSNRIWFAFSEVPQMDMTIEPIVSTKQVTWGLVLRPIESRIREVLAETLVIPNWDDFPFISSLNQALRGGIWESMNADLTAGKNENQKGEVGGVDKVEREYQRNEDHESRSSTPNSLSEKNERTMSMPVLADSLKPSKRSATFQTSAEKDDQKSEDRNELRANPKPPKSPELNRMRLNRSTSFGSPAAPVVGTTTVNAAAERPEVRHDNDKSDAVSAVISISRSRSSSTSIPSIGSPVGSPPEPPIQENSVLPSENIIPDDSSARSVRSKRSLVSLSSSVEDGSEGGLLKTLQNRPLASTFNIPSHHRQAAQEKTAAISSIAQGGIASAGAAMKKWYSKRQDHKADLQSSPALGSQDLSSKPYPNPSPPTLSAAALRDRINGLGSSASSDTSRKVLPPPDIPPPVQKRTEPITVPKRKTLPPPKLPERADSNNHLKVQKRPVPAPPIPSRPGSQNSNREDVIIVAAPQSDPGTPGDNQKNPFHDLSDMEDDSMSASNATIQPPKKNKKQQQEEEGNSYTDAVGVYDGSSWDDPPSPSRNSSRASSRRSRDSMEYPPSSSNRRGRVEEEEENHSRSWKDAEEQELRNRFSSEITGEEG